MLVVCDVTESVFPGRSRPNWTRGHVRRFPRLSSRFSSCVGSQWAHKTHRIPCGACRVQHVVAPCMRRYAEYCNAAVRTPLTCDCVVVCKFTHTGKMIPVQSHYCFQTNSLKKSLCDYTGTILPACVNPHVNACKATSPAYTATRDVRRIQCF